MSGRYATAADLDAELVEIGEALVADGLDRVAWGEVAELRWQVGTFGFHLAELEVRQHAAVHAATLAAIRDGRPGDTEVSAGVTVGEVLATFRAIAEAQARFGVDACHRYVVSFTSSASDVTDVLELARLMRRHRGRRRFARSPCRSSTSSRCSSRARHSIPPVRSSLRSSTIRPTARVWRRAAIARR